MKSSHAYGFLIQNSTVAEVQRKNEKPLFFVNCNCLFYRSTYHRVVLHSLLVSFFLLLHLDRVGEKKKEARSLETI